MIGSNPALGISGTSNRPLRMMLTLNIAGESAGMKNRRSELSIPMQAAATATRVRKGSISRVRVTVSSSFPGTSAKSRAASRISGSAKMIAASTRTPVIMTSALISCVPSRHAASRPSVVSRCVKVGTNAALIAPSAKRSRIRLGIRKATTYASIALLAPNKDASTSIRPSPRTRLVIVARPITAAELASGELGGSASAAGTVGAATDVVGSESFICASDRSWVFGVWTRRCYGAALIVSQTTTASVPYVGDRPLRSQFHICVASGL